MAGATVTCVHCDTKLKLPHARAGAKVKCPKCQKVFVLPEPDDPFGDEDDDFEPPAPRESRGPSRSSGGRKKKKSAANADAAWSWGLWLTPFGFGAMLLPSLGLQFKILTILPPLAQFGLGFLLFLAGAACLALALANQYGPMAAVATGGGSLIVVVGLLMAVLATPAPPRQPVADVKGTAQKAPVKEAGGAGSPPDQRDSAQLNWINSYPKDQVATIIIPGQGKGIERELYNHLHAEAGITLQQTRQVGGEFTVTVAPVSDFQKLQQALTFGTIASSDPAKREVRLASVRLGQTPPLLPLPAPAAAPAADANPAANQPGPPAPSESSPFQQVNPGGNPPAGVGSPFQELNPPSRGPAAPPGGPFQPVSPPGNAGGSPFQPVGP